MLTVIKENIWLVAGSVAVGFGAGFATKTYVFNGKSAAKVLADAAEAAKKAPAAKDQTAKAANG